MTYRPRSPSQQPELRLRWWSSESESPDPNIALELGSIRGCAVCVMYRLCEGGWLLQGGSAVITEDCTTVRGAARPQGYIDICVPGMDYTVSEPHPANKWTSRLRHIWIIEELHEAASAGDVKRTNLMIFFPWGQLFRWFERKIFVTTAWGNIWPYSEARISLAAQSSSVIIGTNICSRIWPSQR